MSELTSVDRIAPLRFLKAAYRPSDWIAVFLKSYETGHVEQRVGSRSLVRSRRFQRWLRWRNLNRWNIYVSVNAIQAGRRTRTRSSIAAIRHVFVEADHAGDQVLADISVRSDLPAPSYVLHSSPGRVHVLWRVAGFDAATAEGLQKQLASELGTDRAATPCTQTTRLPGFFNHKRRPSHLVTARYHDVVRRYSPSDFPSVAVAVNADIAVRATHLPAAIDVERARAYADRVPPAIAGQHGDVHTFRLCCRLTRGFALTDEEALAVIAQWNQRCEPPWSERELRDKLRRARRYGREPFGGLLESGSRSRRNRHSEQR